MNSKKERANKSKNIIEKREREREKKNTPLEFSYFIIIKKSFCI